MTGDWQGIGYSDGLQGEPETFLSEHQEACSEYNIRLNLELYLRGRDDGLETYCDAGNGYRLGRNGSEYSYVCPKRLEAAFLEAYKEGRGIYLQAQKVKRLEEEVKRQQKDIADLELKIRETEDRLVGDGLSSLERQRLLVLLREVEADRPSANHHLYRLEADLRRAKSLLYR